MLQTRLSLLALCCLVLSALSLRVPTSLQFRSKTSLNSLVSPTSKKSTSKVGVVGEANLDWANIGFEYRQTNSFVQCTFKDGKWGEIETRVEPYINLHIGATSLHYGQACFEGMKAFQGADGKVRIFRPQENAKRMTASCNRICMEPPSEEMFIDAVKKAVRDNLSFLPPYGTGGALYIRPILFGSGPRIGLQPSDEYTFIVMVMPVADYYKGGIKPVHAVVIEDYDRAAPRGVGNAKVAGNYAADILASQNAKSRGFPIALYLDAKTNKYIEEFSTSNFLSIDKDGAYVTPKSETILPSVTNKSLMQLAKDEGLDVQQREISIEELLSGKFDEVGACGTAVVLTPVNKVTYGDKVISIGNYDDKPGPTLQKLYDRVRALQNGEEEDKFGWMVEV